MLAFGDDEWNPSCYNRNQGVSLGASVSAVRNGESASRCDKMRVTFRAVLFSLAVGLLAACQSSGTTKFSSFAQEGGRLGERLTLLTWNVQKFRDPEVARVLSNLIGQQKT